MRSTASLLLVAALVSIAARADACRTSQQMRAFLFGTMPPISNGDFAARVQIQSVIWDRAAHPQIRARVLTKIRGGFRGKRVVLLPSDASDCDVPPRPGETGIAIGRTLFVARGELAIDPERALLRPRSGSAQQR